MNNENFKILIVDDNPNNLQVLGSILERSKYKVESALSGFEALEWVNVEKFDLILLDVMMPEIDGFEVCEKIRKIPDYANVPIIFLTAKTDKGSLLKGFELGAQDYINKPFDKSELLARIKTHLELKYSKDKLNNLNAWLEEEVNKKTYELQNANTKLESTLCELRNLDKMKSYFLHLTSSEIRTPLSGILGTLHLLKNQESSFALKELVMMLEKSVNRLEKFAAKSILTSELSSKTYPYKPEAIDLKDLIQFCLIELNEAIELHQVSINLSENNEETTGDRTLIYKALNFIIKNAITHSPEKANVDINCFKNTSGEIVIKVLDYGKGLPQKELENIYSPYRFKKENKNSINELSMYLLKLIMELHNGKVLVYNQPEAGLCVELIFKTNSPKNE